EGRPVQEECHDAAAPAAFALPPSLAREFEGNAASPVVQHGLRDVLVHEPDPGGAPRVQRASGEDQVEGGAEADESGQPHRAAEPGDDAEPYLGEPDAGCGRIAGEACVAGEGELGPAAEAGAVNGGDARDGELIEPTEDALTLPRLRLGFP